MAEAEALQSSNRLRGNASYSVLELNLTTASLSPSSAATAEDRTESSKPKSVKELGRDETLKTLWALALKESSIACGANGLPNASLDATAIRSTPCGGFHLVLRCPFQVLHTHPLDSKTKQYCAPKPNPMPGKNDASLAYSEFRMTSSQIVRKQQGHMWLFPAGFGAPREGSNARGLPFEGIFAATF
ncbi:uncharacterized protein VTP21DRAFT_11113 [Calcarisporiella thermophila]|uniref:uncharacterized protein n=1 Tax=Calcarisporiella thermophila TaxID=911321 RepID=UPI003742282F